MDAVEHDALHAAGPVILCVGALREGQREHDERAKSELALPRMGQATLELHAKP